MCAYTFERVLSVLNALSKKYLSCFILVTSHLLCSNFTRLISSKKEMKTGAEDDHGETVWEDAAGEGGREEEDRFACIILHALFLHKFLLVISVTSMLNVVVNVTNRKCTFSLSVLCSSVASQTVQDKE